MTTTVPFCSSHLDTDTRLLFCEDTYVKIQVEEYPTVESLFIIEVDQPLIVGIIVKNQVICIEYTVYRSRDIQP